jgi:hypothetical protein
VKAGALSLLPKRVRKARKDKQEEFPFNDAYQIFRAQLKRSYLLVVSFAPSTSIIL